MAELGFYTAAWRAKLIPASFRGVPFFYDSVGNAFGRKTVVKEFPGQDFPLVEDLGRLSRKFNLEMFVIGPDYFAARDALIDALETKGSGALNHPYRGKITVALVGEASMSETTAQGGIAKFSATFVQTNDGLFTLNTVDPTSAVTSAIARAQAAVSTAFQAAFSVVNAVSSTVQSAVNVVEGVASGIDSVRGKIASALLVVSNAQQAVADLTSSAAALVNEPSQLAATMIAVPAEVLEDVQNVTNSVAYQAAVAFYSNEDSLPTEGNVIAARTQVDALTNAIAGFILTNDSFTPISAIASQQLTLETNNQNALLRLSKAASIFACGATVPTLTFESYDQAQAMLTSMAGLIDDLLTDDNLEDEAYGPLADLRASLVRYLSTIANSLPELQTYVPIQTLPALVLAYQLYGDSKFESDILARNTQISDPSAVQGGQPIQVLFNG